MYNHTILQINARITASSSNVIEIILLVKGVSPKSAVMWFASYAVLSRETFNRSKEVEPGPLNVTQDG